MRRAKLVLLVLLAFACADQPTELTESMPKLPAAAVSPAFGGFGNTNDIEASLGPPEDDDMRLYQTTACVVRTGERAGQDNARLPDGQRAIRADPPSGWPVA
jgi:hypothetical protein